MLNEVFERFVEHAPVAVMARLGLQRALSADWVDQVFEQHRETQDTRELLFSTAVDLMASVALGFRPSLHAAAQKARGLRVSLTALYDKVNRTDPAVARALVRGSAARLAPVMVPLRKGAAPWLRGYRVRVVDGNHLPASEKRLGPPRRPSAPRRTRRSRRRVRATRHDPGRGRRRADVAPRRGRARRADRGRRHGGPAAHDPAVTPDARAPTGFEPMATGPAARVVFGPSADAALGGDEGQRQAFERTGGQRSA